MAASGHRGMLGTPDHHYLAYSHLWDSRCFRTGVRREERSVPLIQARESQNADRKGPRCSTQRAGIASPHAEGDELSGVTRDGEANAFISGPAAFVGGVPVTRAMIPWAIPEAST